MGLLEWLYGPVETPPAVPRRPQAVPVEVLPWAVYAPASGEMVSRQELPDAIFASGAMGPTIGIKPADGIVYAPVSGVVTVTTGTLHAIGLRSDDGVEVLVHLGVDTVDLLGEGFVGFAELGQHVEAGEALITMDLQRIAAARLSDVVIVAVTNGAAYERVEVTRRGTVKAGEQVMVCVRKGERS